jgi:hypothetical protein
LNRSLALGRGARIFCRRLLPFGVVVILAHFPTALMFLLQSSEAYELQPLWTLLYWVEPVLILVAGAAISATTYHLAAGRKYSMWRGLRGALGSGSVWGSSIAIVALYFGAYALLAQLGATALAPTFLYMLAVIALYSVLSLAPGIAAIRRPGVFASLRRSIRVGSRFRFILTFLLVLLVIAWALGSMPIAMLVEKVGATYAVQCYLGAIVALRAILFAFHASLNGSAIRALEGESDLDQLEAVFE